MHYYSVFWIAYAAGVRRLSPAWKGKSTTIIEEPDLASLVPGSDPTELMSMAEWMRLSAAKQRALLADYLNASARSKGMPQQPVRITRQARATSEHVSP